MLHISELTVNWHVLEACNYDCYFCYAKYGKKSNFSRDYSEILRDLSNLSGKVINFPSGPISVQNIRINFAGGEPFLEKELGSAVSLASELGLRPSFISNGSLLTDSFIEHYGAMISVAGFSIDSFNTDTNQKIGRRDNKYKARIKILVHETGIDEIRRLVEEEWNRIKDTALNLPLEEVDRINDYFAPPTFETLDATSRSFEVKRFEDRGFATWVRANVIAHKKPGYAIANISLKPEGEAPGDITDDQMEVVADLAEKYSFDEIRATHEQNLVLPHVKLDDLYDVFLGLQEAGLATGNLGLISDMIVCPGLDYCALANARSIPVAQAISKRFADIERQYDIGELKLKISGCINACGHHHVGHIGILGVDRKGEEYYQITLGGNANENAAIGKIIGPSFAYDKIVDAVETVVNTYLEIRDSAEESFLDAYNRVGMAPFKERLYA
ncbi:radical SAM protein [uncultured Kiloniella sp.]|uniref:radical SAM protein n=1 Tax=uncultured Kiloniella sp. TaxID=1133091 RepID=UPI00262C9BB5|nr:radical SAM protein [uncultured Kiloniella sp.]